KFAKADITVRTESGNDLGTYHSDVIDGKYQFYVDLNDYYVITYQVEGFPAQVISIDATKHSKYTEIEKNINFNDADVSINGWALLKENPLKPITNLKVNLTNKDKSINKVDTTDAEGRYNFNNLPNDDYYLIYLNEEDEKLIEDSSYIIKGFVSIKGLPYTQASINGMPTDDNGKYRFEVKNKFYGLLSGDTSNLDKMSENDIMAKYGDQTAPGLIFKVQVAAYNNAQNYDGKHLKSLGNIEKIVLDDNITRFTLGSMLTLREGKKLQEKAISLGQDDAFVIVFINGKRTYLEELINSGIFK
ncbi:MAG: carboxypeptidase-like regulatory domain-containing protein, partial [Vicingaceae bacterium]|nr:carboxypeptidase-like regulatory domain-containing protein [Vicingaceae bacterium]